MPTVWLLGQNARKFSFTATSTLSQKQKLFSVQFNPDKFQEATSLKLPKQFLLIALGTKVLKGYNTGILFLHLYFSKMDVYLILFVFST